MPRNENQQLKLARTTTAKRLCFQFCFQFPVSVSISFPFPAFPYDFRCHFMLLKTRKWKMSSHDMHVTCMSCLSSRYCSVQLGLWQARIRTDLLDSMCVHCLQVSTWHSIIFFSDHVISDYIIICY